MSLFRHTMNVRTAALLLLLLTMIVPFSLAEDTPAAAELSEKLMAIVSEPVTPEAFGAVGDGVADDTEAFLKAMRKGNVRLTGKYRLNGTVKIKHAVRVTGAEGATVYNSGQVHFLDDALVEGVTFDCSYTSTGLPITFFGYTVLDSCVFDGGNNTANQSKLATLSEVPGGRVVNCTFKDNYNGRNLLVIFHSANVVVDGCTFTNCGSSGCNLQKGNQHVVVQNCHFEDCCINTKYTDGMLSHYGDYLNGIRDVDIQLLNNTFTATRRPAFCVIRLDGVDQALVSGNVIDMPEIAGEQLILVQDRMDHEKEPGCFVVHNAGIVIENNRMISKTPIGIDIVDCDNDELDLTIRGNEITFTGVEADAAFIRFKWDVSGQVDVIGNTMDYTQAGFFPIAAMDSYVSHTARTLNLNIRENQFSMTDALVVPANGTVSILDNIIRIRSGNAVTVTAEPTLTITGNTIYGANGKPTLSIGFAKLTGEPENELIDESAAN